MFFSKARRIDELEEQLAKTMDQRDNLRKRLEERGEYNRFNVVYDEVVKSTFSFDWKAVNAFSIERIQEWDDELRVYLPTTVIGYLSPTSDEDNLKIGQWKFYCSQDEHTRLVEDFNKYKAKK